MSNRQQITVFTLPHDVLLRCVAGYLVKRDQYKLFSLCSIWKPLLQQCRIIQIVDEQDSEKILVSSPCKWNLFSTSEEYRLKILHICGIDTESNVMHHRPLRFTLHFETLIQHSALVEKDILHFETIKIKHSWKDDAILTNPTNESITRYLASGWRFGVHSFKSMLKAAQTASHQLLPASDVAAGNEPPSFSTLRGVSSLTFTEDEMLFVEMSPQSNDRLQCVMLQEFNDALNMTRLQGVPEVSLLRCQVIKNMTALAHVDTLILNELQLTNISMLGSVRKLEVCNCKYVTNYPVPSTGKGQEWLFCIMNISDISTFANLEKLTLESCNEVTDFSMLGYVQYLTIDHCSELREDSKFPTPLGQNQEWTFILIDMSDLAPEKFKGLFKLTLVYCLEINSLSPFSGVEELVLRECVIPYSTLTEISVPKLQLVSCYSNYIDEIFETEIKLADDVDIAHIEVILGFQATYCVKISTTARSKLKSLLIKDRHRFTIVDLAVEDLVDAEILIVRSISFYYYRLFTSSEFTNTSSVSSHIFTDQTIHIAVELWCIDQDKAVHIYGHVSNWDVSQVTDMVELFTDKEQFNSNINSWNVSNVTTMRGMFEGATSFNHPLNSWNVSNVTSMHDMFHHASSFNQPLHSWDMSKVSDTGYMFYGATSFNQSLDNWNVSNVTDMKHMFQ